LAAVLERANLLVTNDTGTMHVAAAVNCPIVLVSVGYVHFRETGPYGPGHYAVERRRLVLGQADRVPGALEERAKILPEHVYATVEASLDGRELADDQLDGVDVYRSAFAADGCLEWYPLLKRPLRRQDFLRAAYRAMWLDYLGSRPDKVKSSQGRSSSPTQRNAETERESLRVMFEHYAPPEEASVAQWRDEVCADFRALTDIAERGITETRSLIAMLERKRVREAQQAVVRVSAIDEEMRLHGELHEACRPLVHIAKFERDNLEGANPVVLAQTTLQIYRDCKARAQLSAEKITLAADIWQRGQEISNGQ